MSFDDLVEISGGRKVSKADADELKEDGFESATLQEVESAYKAARIFFDNGYDEKGQEMLNVVSTSVSYWENIVQDLIGKTIYFNDSDQRWHYGGTNQYTKDPYLDVQLDDYDRYYALLDKYG